MALPKAGIYLNQQKFVPDLDITKTTTTRNTEFFPFDGCVIRASILRHSLDPGPTNVI